MQRPLTFIIFGATGDLAVKKIFPALASLLNEGLLGEKPHIIAVSRRDWQTEDFRAFLKGTQNGINDALLEHIEYVDVDFDERRGYEGLLHALDARKDDDVLIYLSLSPIWFRTVIEDLASAGILARANLKLLLEKPFGTDTDSARALNELLAAHIQPEQIYRVDHYLGKSAIQAIMETHEESAGLRHILSNATIEEIIIELMETKGVDGRASYDGVGAFRDVGQNHLLEMLAVLMAEYPQTDSPAAWQDARAAVIEAIEAPHKESLMARRGQYVGYEHERGVAPDSATETAFEVVTTFLKGELEGVPVTLRSGKMMSISYARIRVRFKDRDDFPKEMLIEVQPKAQIVFLYCDGSETVFPTPQIKDAYANILHDATLGAKRHFVGEREIIAAWTYTDALVKILKELPLERYSTDKPFFK